MIFKKFICEYWLFKDIRYFKSLKYGKIKFKYKFNYLFFYINIGKKYFDKNKLCNTIILNIFNLNINRLTDKLNNFWLKKYYEINK